MRFNFRGVGQSEGRFDDGVGELDDLRAVAAWARANHPDKILWLAGFSFGAYVSLRLAVELRAAALVSIAPPVGRSWDFSAIEVPTAPWLVIQGGMVRMRKRCRPGTAAFSRTAPQVPMIIFKSTEKKVQVKVRTMTSKKVAL